MTRAVALVAHSQMRFLMADLVKRLKAETGARIHLYCATAQEEIFYKRFNRDGLFDSIAITQGLLRAAHDTGLDADAEIAKARDYERRLGLTINQFAVGDRHLGRGYALLGPHHPRSRHSENTGYIQMLHAFTSLLAFWDGEFRDKGIDLVIGGGAEVAALAHAHGIAYRELAGSRFRNYHFWSDNVHQQDGALAAAFDAADPAAEPVPLDAPYHAHGNFRRRFLSDATLPKALVKSARIVLQFAYWRLRGYEKGRGYYARDMVLAPIRAWRGARALTGPGTARLDAIGDRPFVFYGLQTEPEGSLGTHSPEFFFQHATIAAVSRDLPAGVHLAVKDTYLAVGRRPRLFYRQLAELKNVHLLDLRERGLDVVRRAACVVTINGTVGFEAAALGKPVILLGRHNSYDFLPHVRTARSLAELREHIDWALGDGIDRVQAERDGQRLLRAVVDRSFDLGAYDYFNLHDYDEAVVDAAYRALIESLPQPSEPMTEAATA